MTPDACVPLLGWACTHCDGCANDTRLFNASASTFCLRRIELPEGLGGLGCYQTGAGGNPDPAGFGITADESHSRGDALGGFCRRACLFVNFPDLNKQPGTPPRILLRRIEFMAGRGSENELRSVNACQAHCFDTMLSHMSASPTRCVARGGAHSPARAPLTVPWTHCPRSHRRPASCNRSPSSVTVGCRHAPTWPGHVLHGTCVDAHGTFRWKKVLRLMALAGTQQAQAGAAFPRPVGAQLCVERATARGNAAKTMALLDASAASRWCGLHRGLLGH